MKTLLFPLVGPQSCGSQSQHSEKETQYEPQKGHVVGMICSAMGIRRADTENILKISQMPMGIRVDVEPIMQGDYQTAGGGIFPNTLGEKGKIIKYRIAKADGGTPDNNPAVIKKYYLSDAFFLAAITGEDELIAKIHGALGRPVFGLSLGRKCFKPMIPMKLSNGIVDTDIVTAFKSFPWLPTLLVSPFRDEKKMPYWIEKVKKEALKNGLRTIVETSEVTMGDTRRVFDVPTSFTQESRISMARMPRYTKLSKVSFPGA